MLMATADANANPMKGFFEALFYSEKYKDLTFIVARKEVDVNEIVVKTRSSVLKARIEDPERIPNGRILLDDPNLEHFMEFLKFLYLDDCDITEANIIGLFFLVPSYILYLNLYKFDASGAVTAVFTPALVQHILEQYRPIEAEDTLFRKVFGWAKIHCSLQGLPEEPASIKEAMKDMIPYIRFQYLRTITLATVVRPNELLTTQELLKLFIKFTLGQTNENFEININEAAVKTVDLAIV
uniref:BTB domain-containing protein n=1 Tax=Panagrolaimus sp. ES5 TaxID=591445 RepID=A0AC34F1P7_9BILA